MMYSAIASSTLLNSSDKALIRLVTPKGIIYSLCDIKTEQHDLEVTAVLFREGERQDFRLVEAESLLRNDAKVKELLTKGFALDGDPKDFTATITNDPYAPAPLTRLNIPDGKCSDQGFHQKYGVLTIGKNHYIVSHMLSIFDNELLNECIPKVVLHITSAQLPKWDSLLKKYWIHEDDLNAYLGNASNEKSQSNDKEKTLEEQGAEIIDVIEKNLDQVVDTAKIGMKAIRQFLK